MKRLLLLMCVSIMLSACGAVGDKAGGGNTAPPADKDKPKAGDVIVAKWAAGSFYEGKIDKIDGTKFTIAWLDNSSPSVVDAVDVYSIPRAGSKPDVKAGDLVLAKTGTGTVWTGAEITSIDGAVYKVKAVTGDTVSNVAEELIIKVPPAVAADLKDKAGATSFLKEAQKGKPAIPSDFKPKKGDKVIAEWSTNTWYTGVIDSVSGTNIFVAWDDKSKPSAVNSNRIVPIPTAASGKDMPTVSQFLLIKPEGGSKWDFAQAVTINGTSVEVKLANGQSKTLKPGEFVLLN